MRKLNSFLASLYKIPQGQVEPSPKEPANEGDKKKPALFDKKMIIIGSLVLIFLFGTMFITRLYHQRYNPVQVAPNDPNLYKTVKTDQKRSPSILASVEEDLSKKKLDAHDTLADDVKLIAKKFSIHPTGDPHQAKLSQQAPTAEPKKVFTPAPIIPPVQPSPRPTYTHHSVRGERGKTVATSSTSVASAQTEDETFNTIRLSPSSTVSATTREGSSETAYIPAAIYGNQRIRSGGKARFRTTEAVTFRGVFIPRNTILSTVVFLGNGRIQFQAPAPIIAGQRLPVDLMCVDKDFSTGISYNYDVIDDNVRQVSGSTASNAASTASSVLRYGSPVAAIATDAVRGIASGVIAGKRQKSVNQVEILDGYQVFFKSTK